MCMGKAVCATHSKLTFGWRSNQYWTKEIFSDYPWQWSINWTSCITGFIWYTCRFKSLLQSSFWCLVVALLEKSNKNLSLKKTNFEALNWPVLNIHVKVKFSRYGPGVTQRVGRGIVLLFHYRGTRRGWVVSSTPRPYFTPGKDPVPILQEVGWAPGSVWTGAKSRPYRESIPDRPARSSVTKPTELPGPYICIYIYICKEVNSLFMFPNK